MNSFKYSLKTLELFMSYYGNRGKLRITLYYSHQLILTLKISFINVINVAKNVLKIRNDSV